MKQKKEGIEISSRKEASRAKNGKVERGLVGFWSKLLEKKDPSALSQILH